VNMKDIQYSEITTHVTDVPYVTQDKFVKAPTKVTYRILNAHFAPRCLTGEMCRMTML
jgi:hypothetical protein